MVKINKKERNIRKNTKASPSKLKKISLLALVGGSLFTPKI